MKNCCRQAVHRVCPHWTRILGSRAGVVIWYGLRHRGHAYRFSRDCANYAICGGSGWLCACAD